MTARESDMAHLFLWGAGAEAGLLLGTSQKLGYTWARKTYKDFLANWCSSIQIRNTLLTNAVSHRLSDKNGREILVTMGLNKKKPAIHCQSAECTGNSRLIIRDYALGQLSFTMLGKLQSQSMSPPWPAEKIPGWYTLTQIIFITFVSGIITVA